MEQVTCSKCVLHSLVPGITINENGVCSKCEEHEETIKNPKIAEKMTSYYTWKLNDIVTKVKREKRAYDALVLFSGGKDSAYLLKMVKQKYGLKPLAFSVMHPLVNDTASKNMVDVAQKLGVDLFKFYPDESIYKKLMKYALLEGDKYGEDEYVGCHACSFIFLNSAIITAIKMDIPLIFDGCDVDQSEIPIFLEGEKMKADAAKGIGPLGKIHQIFLDALGEEYRHSFYNFNFEDLKDYNFPSWIAPFTFLDYNFKQNFKELEELGLDSKNFKTIFTNCCAVPFFSYFSIKRFDCLTYIRQYANEIRNGYPFLLQSRLEADENSIALSKEIITILMDEYKKVVLYVVDRKIDQNNITSREKAKILSMAPTHQKIYGPEVCDNFFEQIMMVNHFGKIFDIDLSSI